MSKTDARYEIRKSPSLREQVERSLRSALFSGEMVPGQTYSVPALADKYGMSATPVREAVLELTKEGLLQTVPNKGFRVTIVTQETLEHLTEIRRLIEVPTTLRIARTIRPRDLARLRELATANQEFAVQNDLVNYIETDRMFHTSMFDLCGNPLVAEYVEDLRSRLRIHALPKIVGEGQLAKASRVHLDLLDAMQSGDLKAAERFVTHHLNYGVNAYGIEPGDAAE